MFYLLSGLIILGLTALVWLGLRRINRRPTVPLMAGLHQKAAACGVMVLCILAVCTGGIAGGMALRDALLGPQALSVHSGEVGLAAMLAGLLCPAVVLAYLATVAAYTGLLFKNDTTQDKAALLPNRPKGGYQALEKNAYRVFTALFFVSAWLYAWGLVH